MIQLLMAYFAAVTVGKILKLTAMVGLITAAVLLADSAVDSVVLYIAEMAEPLVGSTEVPIVAMMDYMGLFDALSVVFGAWSGVVTFKLAVKVIDWL